LVPSQNLVISSYFLVKILLAIGLFLYLKLNLTKKIFLNTLRIFAIGGLIQSIVALGQYIRQSNLGIRYLGESIIAPNLPGVAKLSFLGEKLIRSYGTFAHPNILACFLLLALYSAIYLSLKNKSVYLFSLPIISLGLILTFSRTVLFLGLVLLIIFFTYNCLKTKKKEILKPVLVSFISFTVFSLIFLPHLTQRFNIQKEEQAVFLRTFYNKASRQIIKKSPFLGVGLGNFTFKLKEIYPDLKSWQYQPAHNIYLLIVSEVGILALLVFILFLAFLLQANLLKLKTYNLKHFMFYILSFAFLCIGLFDHFFLTINQGILIFWLTLGIMNCEIENKEVKKSA
jgi:O-antigen ligase